MRSLRGCSMMGIGLVLLVAGVVSTFGIGHSSPSPEGLAFAGLGLALVGLGAVS